ncbi:thioredoxin family protein [Pontibacter liquoris]|uniref:thioredoxin family protein n=1 Tax=Pontibacter liquoris TaxID=2905677 RepID=UPI001FA6D6EB|nr:thioredoxin family protein [Pontibacter liquoris]
MKNNRNMKKRSTFLSLLMGVLLLTFSNTYAAGTGDEAPATWTHTYAEASKLSKETHKPIMMVFAGSDWCKPCIMLRKEVWDTEAFKAYAKDNLVLLELDFPRFKKNQLPAEQMKQNEELAAKYDKEGIFPLVVLTDADGKVLAKTGYQPGGAEKYVTHLQSLLK